MFLRKFCYQDQKFKRKFEAILETALWGKVSSGEGPSNGEGLRDIQHSMSIVLDRRFHIWFVMTVYYKMQQILLQNATGVHYKMREVFCYKMRQLLQIATIFLQNATVMRRLLQTATVHIVRSYLSLATPWFFIWKQNPWSFLKLFDLK